MLRIDFWRIGDFTLETQLCADSPLQIKLSLHTLSRCSLDSAEELLAVVTTVSNTVLSFVKISSQEVEAQSSSVVPFVRNLKSRGAATTFVGRLAGLEGSF